MKLFEDTTIWCEVESGVSSDEEFIEYFDKIFNFYDSEYHPDAKMKFYIEINEEDIWVEIKNESGCDNNFTLTIDDRDIDFEDCTAESILKAIKENIIKFE